MKPDAPVTKHFMADGSLPEHGFAQNEIRPDEACGRTNLGTATVRSSAFTRQPRSPRTPPAKRGDYERHLPEGAVALSGSSSRGPPQENRVHSPGSWFS